ncbi:MAG: cytidylate kinase-like family protein [Anaerolineales bacterium]|nr:MAG: cytidylate kinase-like family protein [Anaerolineales bacterium]
MAVVTLSRQLGSLGDEIALLLQHMLNYKIYDREIINKAALRVGKPVIALATIDELGLLGLRPDIKSRQAYLLSVSELMREVADKGRAIIVGRAGQFILKDYPEVYHFRVIAPADVRARRISLIKEIPLECAQAQINTSDEMRYRYLKRYYGANLNDPELYDLIINTAQISPEQAAHLICQSIEQYEIRIQ